MRPAVSRPSFLTFLLLPLLPSVHPIRMYFIDEDGSEKPTPAALDDLDSIVMFRSGVWAMSIVDMFFKFLLVSLLGVMFQSHQIAGVCVAVLCCTSIMAFFALKRPYLYRGGNVISVTSYFGLLAAFISALTEKLEYDKYGGWSQTQKALGGYQVTTHFKNLLFVTWLLPYIVAFAYMVNARTYFKRVVTHWNRREGLCRFRGKRGRRASVRQIKRDESDKCGATSAAFRSDHKRGVHILSIIYSLRPIVREVIHAAGLNAKRVRAKQKQYEQRKSAQQKKTPKALTANQPSSRRKPAWDKNKDVEATLAVAKELDTQLLSMIESFSNGNSGEEEGDSADTTEGKVRVGNVIGNYRPLYWHHFIDVETAARKLSKIAFPHTDVCHRKAQRAEKETPGCVRKSFVKRHLLWGNPVTEQLQQVQEAMAQSKSKRTMSVSIEEGKKAAKDSSGSKEYAHPNMHDIATW